MCLGVATAEDEARRALSRTPLRLIGEGLLEDCSQVRDVDGCHLPHDLEVHTRTAVRDHVSHAAHPAIRQLGDRLARVVGQGQRRLTDDLDASDDGVLPLCVASGCTLVRAGNVRADKPGRIENVPKASNLISVHTTAQQSRGCALWRGLGATGPMPDAGQSPPVLPRLLPPRPPFPGSQGSKREPSRPESQASRRRCVGWPAPLPQTQRRRADGQGPFRRTHGVRCGARRARALARGSSRAQVSWIVSSIQTGRLPARPSTSPWPNPGAACRRGGRAAGGGGHLAEGRPQRERRPP
jgi:hypothetical protein